MIGKQVAGTYINWIGKQVAGTYIKWIGKQVAGTYINPYLSVRSCDDLSCK